jgi:uncharacterized protein (DUF924 family)
MSADYAALAQDARAVLDCWFGEPDSPGFGAERKLWFSRDKAFDAMLRERFGALIEAANGGESTPESVAPNDATPNDATPNDATPNDATPNDATPNDATPDHWQAMPLGALALIIVLDQFSRNCYRNTPRAFAADHKALQVAQRLIASGGDRLLPSAHHRAFAYLPFEHDETPASQRESLRLFKQLEAEPGGKSYYRFAERHAAIIERFGRFPHRNAVLGRASTAEESAFLMQRGSSF